MFCAQCGNAVAEGAPSCARCGAPPGAAAAAASPARAGGTGTGTAAQGYSFNSARLTQADKITGVASVILLISLFLPWFSVSGPGGTISWSGMTAHGYLWLVFLLCLGIVAFLVFGAGFTELPVKLPAAREPLLLTASGLNLLLVVLAFFVSPGYLALGVGWSFGAFVALIAAIAACAPLAMPLLRARTGR
jgi:hypothetical protein